MSSHERRRHRMRAKFDEVLGSDVAGDLMESLPPFDWTQIATKDDLQLIHGRLDNMDRRFDNIDGRLDNMDRRFDNIDGRFDNMDRRFDNIDGRFGNMDRHFDNIDGRFDTMNDQFGRSANTDLRR